MQQQQQQPMPLLQCCWSNARLHSHRGACRAIAITCRSSLASHCATRIRPAKQCCLLLQLHAFWLSCICVSALCLVCVAVGSSVQPGARAQPAAGSTGTQGLTLSCRYLAGFAGLVCHHVNCSSCSSSSSAAALLIPCSCGFTRHFVEQQALFRMLIEVWSHRPQQLEVSPEVDRPTHLASSAWPSPNEQGFQSSTVCKVRS